MAATDRPATAELQGSGCGATRPLPLGGEVVCERHDSHCHIGTTPTGNEYAWVRRD